MKSRKTPPTSTDGEPVAGAVPARTARRIMVAAVALVATIDLVIVVTQLDYYRGLDGLTPTVGGVVMRIYALVPVLGEALSLFFGMLATYAITRDAGRYRRYLRLMWVFASIAAVVNSSHVWHHVNADDRLITALVLGGLSLAGPLVWHTFTGLRVAVEVTGASIAELAAVARQWARHPWLSWRCARWVDLFPEYTRADVWEMVTRAKREKVLQKVGGISVNRVNSVNTPVHTVSVNRVNPAVDTSVNPAVDSAAGWRHWWAAWRGGKRSTGQLTAGELVNTPVDNQVNPGSELLSRADVADLDAAFGPVDVVGELGVIGGDGERLTPPVDTPRSPRPTRAVNRRASSEHPAESTGELRNKALIVTEWFTDHQPGQLNPERRSQAAIARARGVSKSYVCRLFGECAEGKHANPWTTGELPSDLASELVNRNVDNVSEPSVEN